MALIVEQFFPQLAERWEISPDMLQSYWMELRRSTEFLQSINIAIEPIPEFSNVQFTDVSELRVYRCMLYLFVRVVRPQVMVETGVLNGLSSAFILLGMAHNAGGKLLSIDMPPLDERIIAQGTRSLPSGKMPGWLIPNELRNRHELRLGPAEQLLPAVLMEHGHIDAFLHDSDHAYSHMMFEMGLAWRFLRDGGWLLADNVEQNPAFHHFCIGVNAPGLIVASFDTPERTWLHGLLRKPAAMDAAHAK